MSDTTTAAPSAPTSSAPAPTSTPATSTPSSAPSATQAPSQATGAAPEQQGQPAAPPQPRTYKLKVNGNEQAVPADAIDNAAKALGLKPEELLRGSQLTRAAYERMEAAAKEAQRIEALKAKAKENPWAVASELAGLKDEEIDQLAEKRLLERLQREAMSPEQRRIAELEAERQRLQAERDEQVKTQQQQAMEQQTKAAVQHFNQTIPKAMESAGLPKTTESLRLVADHLKRQLSIGLQPDVAYAAQEVRQFLDQRNAAVYRAYSPQQLEQLLGKEAIDNLMRYRIEQAKGAPAQPPPPKPPETPKPAGKSYLTPKEWDALYG